MRLFLFRKRLPDLKRRHNSQQCQIVDFQRPYPSSKYNSTAAHDLNLTPAHVHKAAGVWHRRLYALGTCCYPVNRIPSAPNSAKPVRTRSKFIRRQFCEDFKFFNPILQDSQLETSARSLRTRTSNERSRQRERSQ
jgi:hypothetical protein